MFFENLARLRTRPLHERKMVAIVLSAGLTGVIVLVWLSVLVMQHKLDTNNAQLRADPVVEQDKTASWENMLQSGSRNSTGDTGVTDTDAWQNRYDEPGAPTTPVTPSTESTTASPASTPGANTTDTPPDPVETEEAGPTVPSVPETADSSNTATEETRDIFNSTTP